MRLDLWPHHAIDELRGEAQTLLLTPNLTPVFLCISDQNEPIGFLEGGIRPYADGCDTNRVGYVEGWFVKPSARGKNIGTMLMEAFFEWCKAQNITEVASDTWLWNEESIKAHTTLGFKETERLVHFRKNLLQ